jgi:Protein of unknown function (DUF3047)
MKQTLAVLFLMIASFACAEPCSEWNFNSDLPGTVPNDWKARGGPALPTYQIKQEDGNKYISAESIRSGVQMGIEIESSASADYRLSWRWRVHKLPSKGDESRNETMDSAAAVYAVFGRGLFPKILKYVWSTNQKPGTVLKHPRTKTVRIVVLSSGSNQIGTWQTVSRQLLHDFKTYFGSEPRELTAIGVKTDSDSTLSHAKADYDDFLLCKNE